MKVEDKVRTPMGDGIVVGWYNKGNNRTIVSVKLDDRSLEPEVPFDILDVTLITD